MPQFNAWDVGDFKLIFLFKEWECAPSTSIRSPIIQTIVADISNASTFYFSVKILYKQNEKNKSQNTFKSFEGKCYVYIMSSMSPNNLPVH